MVQKLIEQNQEASFLDPACGSGTFLYFAIKEKRERLPLTQKTLEHILNSVSGVDIHPLAVITAKTNYLLALGDLLKKRKGKVSIPVYLADTISLPERETQITLWVKIKLKEEEIYLSEKLLENPPLYDEAIEATREFAKQNAGKKAPRSNYLNFIQTHYPSLLKDTEIAEALFKVALVLKSLIETGRDTIQAFILKNIYKPLFLKGRFDFVIGNPPWLAFRYAEPDYQKILKDQIIKYYTLLAGRGELITHLELGTLFLLRTADLYLKDGGAIAFILPRSIFTAAQHSGLREGKFTNIELSFKELWDLEEVEPLFNVPACVLFARKQAKAKLCYPISGQRVKGRLPRRNTSLDEAQQILSKNEVDFYIHKRGTRSFWATAKQIGEERESFYKKHFFQGATIVPRSFWFVEIKESPLGFDPKLPPLESSERAKKQAKQDYKGLALRGNVESKFLYATLLSTDLLPFGHLGFRLVVLPIEVLPIKPGKVGYRLIKSNEARGSGYVHLANWLEKVQDEWEKRRGAKAKDISAIDWLNYRKKLTSQDLSSNCMVLYPDVQRVMTSTVIEGRIIDMKIGQQKLLINNVIVDYTNYYFETNNNTESYYLCAILNSSIADSFIQDFRRKKQRTHPHVSKKIFDAVPIPQFNPSDKNHLRLAELGKLCTRKVSRWLQSGGPGKIKSIGVLRSRVREMLKEELTEIDRLVQQILES